jgi:hypothetical protein
VVDWKSKLRGETMTGIELALYHLAGGQVIEVWFYPDEKSATDCFFASE